MAHERASVGALPWPEPGPVRAYLTRTGGAWRFVAWDGRAWLETAAPRWMMDAPDGRAWLRLRCVDGRATKLWRLGPDGWDKAKEEPGGLFVAEALWVEDSAEAWAELFREWAGDAGAFLVRGVRARGFGEELVRRAKVADKGAVLGPHPVGRRVVVLDFDGLDVAALGWPEWPGAVRWPNVDEATELVRRALQGALPGRFWGAAAAFRWSASTGFPGGKRGPVGWSRPSCHVALVLDRPVYDESLYRWLRAKVPVADASVAEAVKALFLAAPLVEGAASPWPADFPRVGLLEGRPMTEAPAELVDGWTWQAARDEERAAEVAALAEAASRAKQRELYAMTRTPWGDGWAEREAERPLRFGEALMRRAVDAVLGAGEGSRHATLLRQANHLGRFVAGGLLEEARVRGELLGAWARAAPGRGDEGEAGFAYALDTGKSSPTTWADVLDEEGRRNGS